jgi:hypothetical protein
VIDRVPTLLFGNVMRMQHTFVSERQRPAAISEVAEVGTPLA